LAGRLAAPAAGRGESGQRRLAQYPLEVVAAGGLAVRRQDELYGKVEQGPEPLHDVVARHVLAAAEPDFQPVAEVGKRVARDERVDRRQPQDEVVVLAARVSLDAERPRPGTVEVPFGLARPQPGEILALHPAHLVGVDAELLDPVLPRVRG